MNNAELSLQFFPTIKDPHGYTVTAERSADENTNKNNNKRNEKGHKVVPFLIYNFWRDEVRRRRRHLFKERIK